MHHAGPAPRRIFRSVSWALLLLTALVAVASAQEYFGRNKVRYNSFRFRRIDAPHFDVYFYPKEQLAAQELARMAERWQGRYTPFFNHDIGQHKPIVLYENAIDFQQTNIIPGLIEEGTGGVTEPLKDRVVLPLTGIGAETDHVIGHELVHVYQFDIAQNSKDTLRVQLGRLPTWFIEGMAEYLSIGRNDPNTSMWMRDAILRNDFPKVKDLDDTGKYFPYRYGQALWALIGGVWGDDVIPRLYEVAGSDGLDEGFHEVLGVSADSLSKLWKQATREAEMPVAEGRTTPRDTGEPLLVGKPESGVMNLAPEISPDGRTIAFLSERGVFAIDLYLADARTGKVLKRLTSTATDPHMDALRFIDSAGSWSPDGKRFAFVITTHGRNEMAILDLATLKVEREIRIDEVGSLTNPSWSPDGSAIVISGQVDGQSDLYLCDLQSGRTRRLTNDRYADTQPTWSPDGRTIAFATDRGAGTDLGMLEYGNLKIGFYDMGSGEIRVLDPFPGSKHINPQYAPDGRGLYFISDHNGVSDIFRLDLGDQRIYQVTNVRTGVSGITGSSPAMSVARGTGRLVFSIYQNGNYEVYGRDAAQTEGTAVKPGVLQAGVLAPTRPSTRPVIVSYLADARTGLLAGPFPEHPYSARLRLDYVGVPTAGIAVDRYGTSVGGAIGLYFSDMLTNRELGVSVQSNGGIRDLGGEVDYQNNRTRWTWGASIGHIPYLTVTQTNAVQDTVTGQIAFQQLFQRQYVDRGTFLAFYPFSTTRRLEAGVGYTRITFSNQIEQIGINNGTIVSDVLTNAPSTSGLNLAQTYGAFVYDNSFFGFTSPVKGGRYRLEAEPTWGSLTYTSMLGDYRRYLFARPFTFAVRGLHYGRYGPDAESFLLSPLYVGYSTLIRGYDINSFSVTECSGTVDCPEFDRLTGSRIAVGNAELRLALLGDRRLGLIHFPMIPVELVGFADMGAAWSKDQKIRWVFDRNTTDRVPVFSTGASIRVNVLGAAVVEGFYAHAYQRPHSQGHWGVQLAPGW